MRLLGFIHSNNKQSLSVHHASGTMLDAEGNMKGKYIAFALMGFKSIGGQTE